MATQGSHQKKEQEEKNRDLGEGMKPEPLPGQMDGVEKEYEKERSESKETQPSQQPSEQGNVNKSERPGENVVGEDEETGNRTGRVREGVE